jgi:DNA-binding transcriptional regulator PaaX
VKKPLRERSPLVYVLVGLIPYSKPNLLLSYKPSLFFKELEKVSRYKQSALKAAYWRAQQQGLIEQYKNIPILTKKGQLKIAPFIAEKLESEAKLMVIFDVPEDQALKRRKLRQVLKEWRFTQVQKSVWMTDRDYREELIEIIKELHLVGCVELYECARHFPR